MTSGPRSAASPRADGQVGGSGQPLPGAAHGIVEHLFRHESARLVSLLARWLGARHLDLAEEAVQDALVQAMRTWPSAGVPDNPAGWLHRTARNRCLDLLRRSGREVPPSLGREEVLARQPAVDRGPASTSLEDTGFDPDEATGEDGLRMLLFCCHPALKRPAQVCLALKLCAGLGTDEIARAFQVPVSTVQQRLVRAKRTLRQEEATLDLPPAAELADRVQTVQAILFAIYGEGYVATTGGLTRDDLIGEAIRLTSLLAAHPLGDTPATHALLAMMLLQTARLPARSGPASPLLTTAEQNPAHWDQRLISRGLVHLDRAASGDHLTDYHLLAEIAAHHALPDADAGPDWQRILGCYDLLLARRPGAIIRLNRAVALANTGRSGEARAEIDRLRHEPELAGYHLFHATDAELHSRVGDAAAADRAWQRAERLTNNDAERAFIAGRRAALAQGAPAAGAGTEPSSAGEPSLLT